MTGALFFFEWIEQMPQNIDAYSAEIALSKENR